MIAIPKSIWLIEDNQSFADSLAYIMNQMSDLRCTQHLQSAEELFSFISSPQYTQAPDLILMDIQLRGMSGIEAVSMLKNRMNDIPVVMLTLNDKRETILEAMRAGAVGYIVKGDPFDHILDVIRQAIQGRLLVSKDVKSKLLGHFHQERVRQKYELTSRQKEVLVLMCDGLSKAAIADQLSITRATADNHFRHIYQRLGVNSAHAAVALALKEGLV